MKRQGSPERLERRQAEEWASWFHAVADPTRVMILHLLATSAEPLSVGEITAGLDVGQSTTSHHLAKLAEVGFVLVERHGTSTLWRINANCLHRFPSAVDVVMGNAPAQFPHPVATSR